MLCACSDDEPVFDFSISAEDITFTPVKGGAVMHYKLPRESNVYSIIARYTKESGEEALVTTRAYVDTLLLPGFNKAQDNVPVQISFSDQNGVESAPIEKVFQTLESPTYAFLDNVKVSSAWDGVQVDYRFDETVDGVVNRFYVGTNPFTNEIDTLYLDNMSVTPDEDISFYQNVPIQSDNLTFVMRIQDSEGNYVRSRIWEGLAVYASEELPSSNFTLEDPGNWSVEDSNGAFGLKYLTDGDLMGETRVDGDNMSKYYTYVTRSGGANGGYVIVDMKGNYVPAAVRIYGMVQAVYLLDYNLTYNQNYGDRLPCSMDVFASTDKETWVKVAELRQSPLSLGWSKYYQGFFQTKSDWEANAQPYYCDIQCEVDDKAYRYLKIQCNDMFNMNSPYNAERNMTYHELKVFVQRN